MKLLALDLSSTICGYCYTGEDGQPVYGNINATDQGRPFLRALFLSRSIVNLVRKIQPDKIVIEELTSARGLDVVRTLMRSEGQVLTRLYDAGYVGIHVRESEYRSAAGFPYGDFAKGQKLKARIKLWIESLGHKPEDDNESDAICLWLGALVLDSQGRLG